MTIDNITFKPIGIIHSPYKEPKDTPIQPHYGKGIKGTIEIFDEYREGLLDLDGFSHITLLFYFHRSEGYKLKVVPYLDDTERGLFATRAPRRPNPIGLSVVRLEKIEDGIIYISDLDILDNTPLLDIKPYVKAFNEETELKSGWLENRAKKSGDHRADNRFHKD